MRPFKLPPPLLLVLLLTCIEQCHGFANQNNNNDKNPISSFLNKLQTMTPLPLPLSSPPSPPAWKEISNKEQGDKLLKELNLKSLTEPKPLTMVAGAFLDIIGASIPVRMCVAYGHIMERSSSSSSSCRHLFVYRRF
jgi:hypothetical protein